ncbi:Asp23/Gls24 family envelope stress response protein [Corynebacterium meridianum]|uniref:Asp23/Gls24 family envelope stress response protein n=1 Tax=Corynebacterium meridianum TaxID=2765363 RepID=A0A934I841_9CORY|nr:Asp23/Gls24 family envelope stress response protein [Corynebacterium meridianum]MBI8990024.1 Asp23/Gls24 family envelope stress response protein [Corynebacterium meridianum]
MTKRSGRSRESERRSSTDASNPSENLRNGAEEPTGSPGARLRAEAERRADQALAEIVRDDTKAEEDRRILRESGVPVDSGDTVSGATPDGVPRTEEPTESPDAPSSAAPGEHTGSNADDEPAEAPSRPEPAESGSVVESGFVSEADTVSPESGRDSSHEHPSAPQSVNSPAPDRNAADATSEHHSVDGRAVTEPDDAHADVPPTDTDPGTTGDTEGPRAGHGPEQSPESEPREDSRNDKGEQDEAAVPEHLRPAAEPDDHNPSRGWVKISEKTVTKIVRQAAASVPGTTDQAGGLDVLGRNYPRFDVELDSNSDAVAIDAYIAVSWPSPVTRVAETVRTTIFDWVRDMTDIPVVCVNVTVGPIIPGSDRVTEAELNAFDTTPRLRSVVVTATNAALREIVCSARNSGLAPVSVRSGSESLKPVTVSGPDNATFRDISTGTPGELLPITVSGSEELRAVSVTGEAAATVYSPEVAPETPLREIRVPEQEPLGDIDVAVSRPLAPVTVPEPAPLKPIAARELPTVTVSVPAAPNPRSVTAPRPRPVRTVESPEPTRLTSVHTPDTHRLAQIHAETLRVSSVKAPRPARVTLVKRNDPVSPRKPRVDARPVNTPRQSREREIRVTPTELRPISVKPSTIIPVSVDPANAKAVFER